MSYQETKDFIGAQALRLGSSAFRMVSLWLSHTGEDKNSVAAESTGLGSSVSSNNILIT